jgi:hypothetical protein
MTGISGGGWTTTLVAAIDPRIQVSFPVAGTLPFYLRSSSDRSKASSNWGDWEQKIPGLYTTVNYLELYILGAYGEGRYQMQILNQFDPCCFAGVESKTYSDIVSRRVALLGKGGWDLMLDKKNRSHAISKEAQEEIINKLSELWSK